MAAFIAALLLVGTGTFAIYKILWTQNPPDNQRKAAAFVIAFVMLFGVTKLLPSDHAEDVKNRNSTPATTTVKQETTYKPNVPPPPNNLPSDPTTAIQSTCG